MIDQILWKLSRAYRRRKMRQSRVHAELLQQHPEVERFEFRLNEDERAMLARASKDETALLAMQLHRAGRLSDDALAAALNLERPAILARGRASDRPEGARGCSCSPYAWNPLIARESCPTHGYLAEKLADEAITRGREPEPEYWCEHCPQYGYCCVCGQDHAGSLGGA